MNIPDIIEATVNQMKQYTPISVINEAGGILQVKLTPKDYNNWYLKAKVLITHVDGDEYYGEVTELHPAQSIITVKMTVTIAEGNIATFCMDINYKHGHPLDIYNQLVKMATSKSYKKRRFPVIALIQDFEENIGPGINETPIQIVIAYESKPEWTAKQRYDQVFEGKKLTALYERFIKYLRVNNYVYFRPMDHSKFDRLYWGRAGAFGNEANKAEDFLDAIEIQINLKTLNIC